MQWPLEDHLVVTEQLTVVGGHQHERVVAQPALIEHRQHPPDLEIELAHHPVVAGGHAGELLAV